MGRPGACQARAHRPNFSPRGLQILLDAEDGAPEPQDLGLDQGGGRERVCTRELGVLCLLQEQHKEGRRSYYACKNVEKALQRHIQDAIEDKFLKSLVDKDTQLIQEDVPAVLKYLFDLYGKVPSEEVKQKENKPEKCKLLVITLYIFIHICYKRSKLKV